MPPHPLTNFETQIYHKNQSKFNGVYSKDNLPKQSLKKKFNKIIKDGEYVINLGGYSDFGTHWVALYVYNDDVTYLDSCGVEHIPKEIKKFIDGSLSIKTNIFRIQAYDSTMCGYFCIGFINFMLAAKTLIDFINLFSANEF